MKNCPMCNGCGDKFTYANQACVPIKGRVVGIDWCIHHIVAALNAGGIETIACCCGHGSQEGRIDLADGRVLVIRERAGESQCNKEEGAGQERLKPPPKQPLHMRVRYIARNVFALTPEDRATLDSEADVIEGETT